MIILDILLSLVLGAGLIIGTAIIFITFIMGVFADPGKAESKFERWLIMSLRIVWFAVFAFFVGWAVRGKL